MSATTIRAAVGSIVTGLGYRVAPGPDFEDLADTDGGIGVAVGLEVGQNDEWGGTRAWALTLRAMVLRGPDDVGARSDAETMSAALRGAMLAASALGSVGAHAVADSETIAPAGDRMQIEHAYTIQAPA